MAHNITKSSKDIVRAALVVLDMELSPIVDLTGGISAWTNADDLLSKA